VALCLIFADSACGSANTCTIGLIKDIKNTHHTTDNYSVSQPSATEFVWYFPKQLGIFSPNFTL